MFKQEIIELIPIEKDVDLLLQKAGFYIQTYRFIEALPILDNALEIVEDNNVRWPMKSAVYQICGQVHIFLDPNIDDGLNYFIKSYEIIEDGNKKADVACKIAKYFLQEGALMKAKEYAEKALQTATESEPQSIIYQIQGGIALKEGDYTRAIELMNKAAELAESSKFLAQLAMIIMDLTTVFIKIGKPETALSEICRAERYVKESHNPDLYMRCAIRKAKILYSMKKDEEAKKLIIALDEQKI